MPMPRLTSRPRRSPREWRPETWGAALVAITQAEAAAGATLALGMVGALVWANSGWGASYSAIWNHAVTWFPLPAGAPHTARSVVNQGLMTVFFLGVGLEIGRERTMGSLREPLNAVLPVAAALAGMAGAALTYLVVVLALGADSLVRSGWGIPMATDVAFALGALALLGRRIPRELRVFVLALAVADDVASVIVLAVVSSTQVHLLPLLGALVVLVVLWRLRSQLGRQSGGRWLQQAARAASSWWPYALGVVAEWYLLYLAGVEPPLAGVFVGVLVPCQLPPPAPGGPSTMPPPSVRLDQAVLPLSTLVVLPLFALANTGIHIEASLWTQRSSATVLVAVSTARVVGKLVGIAGASALLVRLGVTRLPPQIRGNDLVGIGLLCGIGFTVPLLFADATFAGSPDLIAAASVGLLVGSLVSFLMGSAWLLVAHKRRAASPLGP